MKIADAFLRKYIK